MYFYLEEYAEQSSHDFLISSQKAVACFLHDNYVFALFVPAAIVLFGNLGVTITAAYIAHRYHLLWNPISSMVLDSGKVSKNSEV